MHVSSDHCVNFLSGDLSNTYSSLFKNQPLLSVDLSALLLCSAGMSSREDRTDDRG